MTRKSKMDGDYLRPAALRFGAAAALAVAAVAAAAYVGDRAEAGRHEQETALAAMRERYFQARESRRTLAIYEGRFDAYRKEGLIGPERRLAWLEQLRQAVRELNLPRFNFTLASRAPYAPDGADEPPAGAVMASEMTLKLALWHEGDLLRLFDRLRTHAHGLIRVRSCDIRRLGGTAEGEAQLEADCILEWLTAAADNGEAQP